MENLVCKAEVIGFRTPSRYLLDGDIGRPLNPRLLSDTDIRAVTGERRNLVSSCHQCEPYEWLLSISSYQQATFCFPPMSVLKKDSIR